MTPTLPPPRIGPSEAQSIAIAQRDLPHLDDHRRSRTRRRPDAPPTNVDALVAWFAAGYQDEVPDRLHGKDVWADHGKPAREVIDRETGERAWLPAIEGVGGSELGSPRDAGLIPYLDAPPHLRDDEGDLVRPMRSAMAAFRRERTWTGGLLLVLAEAGFAWRSLIDKAVYRAEHRHGEGTWCRCPRRDADDVTDSRRVVVMALPADVLEHTLVSALTRLWWLVAERETHIRSVDVR